MPPLFRPLSLQQASIVGRVARAISLKSSGPLCKRTAPLAHNYTRGDIIISITVEIQVMASRIGQQLIMVGTISRAAFLLSALQTIFIRTSLPTSSAEPPTAPSVPPMRPPGVELILRNRRGRRRRPRRRRDISFPGGLGCGRSYGRAQTRDWFLKPLSTSSRSNRGPELQGLGHISEVLV